MPIFVLHFILDKDLNLGLEICLHSIVFPNKSLTKEGELNNLFCSLLLLLFSALPTSMDILYCRMDVPTLGTFLSPTLAVNSV